MYTLVSFLQATVSKKKMYYNMRVKTLQRNKADLMCRLEMEKAALQSNTKKRIQKLYSAVKDVCIYLLCTNNVNFFLVPVTPNT